MVPKICSVNECNKPVKCKALCEMHYQRNRINGDPIATKIVRRNAPMGEFLEFYTNKSGNCWMWTGSGERYGKITRQGRTVSAHRAAYEENFGPIPDGAVVRHKCDTPKCVRPEHLELGSNADNSRDMTDRDRQAKGTRQWCAKMTPESVAELRELYSIGRATMPQLSDRYGLSLSTVGKIIHRVTWKHVPERKVA